MSICPNCGFDALEEGKTCAVCGETPVDPADPEVNAPTERLVIGTSFTDRPTMEQPRLFADRYLLDGLLGRGGMGSVFRVIDNRDGQARALKILHDRSEECGNQVERFRREVATLERIRHPAIPAVFVSGVWRDQMYFVAELVEGENLRSVIRRSGAFEPLVAAGIAASVAEALNVAHENAVVHRDIKPHNIMLCPDGSIRLLDFGVARQVGSGVRTITGTGLLVGTPEYMAPEQFMGTRADGRSDIYSLGITLFELVTGRLPFVADTPVSLAMKHAHEPPPEPRALSPHVPHWLNRIILRCLEKDPSSRFSTASDLATALRRAQVSGRRYVPLPSGDYLIQDDPELDEWTMVLASRQQKAAWREGMTLLFRGNHFKLDFISSEDQPRRFQLYHFHAWPQGEVFRYVVDYDASAAVSEAPSGLFGRLKNIVRRD